MGRLPVGEILGVQRKVGAFCGTSDLVGISGLANEIPPNLRRQGPAYAYRVRNLAGHVAPP